MQVFPRLSSFRNKILLALLFCSLIPLIIVALVASRRVQSSYQDSLFSFFQEKAIDHEHMINNFVQSNLLWVRTLASQDILLEEIEFASKTQENTDVTIGNQTLFVSLTSIVSEHPFVDRVYVVDTEGKVLVSTSSKDIGAYVPESSFLSIPRTQKVPYMGRIVLHETGKRTIPVSAPLVRKNDRVVIGVLVIDFKATVIQSLMRDEEGSALRSYLLDQQGAMLTTFPEGAQQAPHTLLPYTECSTSSRALSGEWVSIKGDQVYGISRCIHVHDAVWTLILEQPLDEAYRISRQLTYMIFWIALLMSGVVGCATYLLSRSLSRPIHQLVTGVQTFGRGAWDIRIQVQSNDEFQQLATACNDMAAQISTLVRDLKTERDQLSLQKRQLDASTDLLIRRDALLQQTNASLKTEKEKILAERNTLTVILSGIRDAVLAVDMERRVVISNAAAATLIGLSQNDIDGRVIDDIFHIADTRDIIPSSTYCPISPETSDGIVFAKEHLTFVKQRGGKTIVDMVVGHISKGKTLNIGAILTFHDRSAERDLEEMKLDFVSMAAHELRTPLTAIIGYVELLRQDVGHLDDQQKIFLDRLAISSETLRTLIDNLLNVSRIERGILKIDLSVVQMVDLVKAQIANFDQLLKHKQQRLIFSLPEALPGVVCADPIRINQVLANLIGNAINYTAVGGQITIRVFESDHAVEVVVQDTGVGIPSEAIPKLFTKFFRVTGLLEQGSKGNGLGLYISKSIIEMHKGKIWVESEIGKGSSFHISLKCATDEEIRKVHEESAHALRPGMRHGMLTHTGEHTS